MTDNFTQIVDPDNEATSLTYDAGGRRTSLIQGNGVMTSYTYDAANRTTSIVSPVQSFKYTYDLGGNPLSKTFANGTSEAYTYDSINELTSVTTPSFIETYLMFVGGNRNTWSVKPPTTGASATVSQGYTYNTFHQPTQVLNFQSGVNDTWAYTYDNNGNRTALTDTRTLGPPQAVQTTTYTWNLDDRLTKIVLPNLVQNTFKYDANGIRVGKSDSTGNVRYLLDGASIVATYDAVTNVRLATYIQNPQRADEIVTFKNAAGLKYYPHTDMLGSTYALTGSTGTTQATWSFDGYGTRTQTLGTLSYAFGFTGREHEADTGLIYSRQRYYDSAVGSWLSPDRLGMPDGPNRYSYALDRPTRSTDLNGTWVDSRESDPTMLILLQSAISTQIGWNYYIFIQFQVALPILLLSWSAAASEVEDDDIGIEWGMCPKVLAISVKINDLGSAPAEAVLVHEMRHAIDDWHHYIQTGKTQNDTGDLEKRAYVAETIDNFQLGTLDIPSYLQDRVTSKDLNTYSWVEDPYRAGP